jgi:ankyrin repeat protein
MPRYFDLVKGKLKKARESTPASIDATASTVERPGTAHQSHRSPVLGPLFVPLDPGPNTHDNEGNKRLPDHEPAAPPAASTTPDAKPAMPAQLKPSTVAPPSLSEQLWDAAYDGVKRDEPSLVRTYEEILSWELGCGQDGSQEVQTASAIKNVIESDPGRRRRQMAQLVERRQARAEKRNTAMQVARRGVEILGAFKEVVAGALEAYPPAALAFAGVCLLSEVCYFFRPRIIGSGGTLKYPTLQRLTVSIEASIKNREGLEYVVERHKWYLDLSELLFRDSWAMPDVFERAREGLHGRIVELYKALLLYQMKSVCAYYKLRRILTFIQDQVAWNDWEGSISEIKQPEDLILRDATLYQAIVSNEVKVQHLDLTRFMLNDATRSKSNKLISSFSIPGLNYEEFMNSPNKPPAPDTCQWFREHAAYRQWRERSQGVLVVSAPPGCGKSVLSRALVHELRKGTSSDKVILHFFFRDSAMQNKAHFALCSMLHQLFTQHPNLVLPLRDEIERHKEESLQSNLSVLWDMFTRSITNVKVVCVLDGLDECESVSLEGLIDLMGDSFLSPISENLRFIVTCRPDETLLGRFAPFPSVIWLRAGEYELTCISSEISRVIDHRLREIETRKWNPLPSNVAEKLRTGLKSFGNRTYLWLRLVFEILERDLDRREESCLELLHQVPKTVEEAYSLLLRRIPSDSHETVHEILCLLVAAGRLLSGAELQAAHNAYTEVKTRGKQSPVSMDDAAFSMWLQNKCGFFVQMYGGKVHFIHQTAKEHLLAIPAAINATPCSVGNPLLGKGCIVLANAHRIMAESCILYLSKTNAKSTNIDWSRLVSTFPRQTPPNPWYFRVKKAETTRLSQVTQLYEKYQFSEYASGYWAYHHHRCQTIDETSSLESLSDIREWLWPRYFALFDKPNLYTVRVAEMALASRSSTNCLVSPHPDVARKYWPFDLVLSRSDRTSPHLLWGIQCGHWRMVCRGIERGEVLTVQDTAGKSLLDMACDNDDVPMVRLLLRQQPASWGLNSQKSPLFRCRSRKAADLLIAAGAPVTVRDGKGNTALHAAAGRGDVSVIQALLDKDADASWTNNDGSTPLHRVRVSAPDVVNLLVLEGCPIDARNYAGDTVLHTLSSSRASRTGSLEAALQQRAEVNSQNNVGQTPLHLARSPAVVDCLLRHRADPCAADKDGRMPFGTILYRAGSGNGTYAAAIFAARENNPNEPLRGSAPLVQACHLNDDKLVIKFLKAGADPHLPCPGGLPFLSYYLSSNPCHREVLEELLARGVKPEPQVGDSDAPAAALAAAEPRRYSTLNLILGRGNQSVTVGYASHILPILHLLLQHRADFKAVDPDGKSCLHVFAHAVTAAAIGDTFSTLANEDFLPIANLLLKHGPPVTTADNAQSTPLHELCGGGWRQGFQRPGGWRALHALCNLLTGTRPSPSSWNSFLVGNQ